MEVENEQYTEGGADEQQSVPGQTTQSAADQDKTHGEQWQWQAENEWGRPPYHQEHASDAGTVPLKSKLILGARNLRLDPCVSKLERFEF